MCLKRLKHAAIQTLHINSQLLMTYYHHTKHVFAVAILSFSIFTETAVIKCQNYVQVKDNHYHTFCVAVYLRG